MYFEDKETKIDFFLTRGLHLAQKKIVPIPFPRDFLYFTSMTRIYKNHVYSLFFLFFPMKVSKVSKNEVFGREKLLFRPYWRPRIRLCLTIRFRRKTYFAYRNQGNKKKFNLILVFKRLNSDIKSCSFRKSWCLLYELLLRIFALSEKLVRCSQPRLGS